MEGKIVKLTFPQGSAAESQTSLCPQDIPKYGDLLLCAISSQLHQYNPDLGLLIDQSHPDFAASGLKVASIIRLDTLITVPEDIIPGSIGEISTSSHRILLKS